MDCRMDSRISNLCITTPTNSQCRTTLNAAPVLHAMDSITNDTVALRTVLWKDSSCTGLWPVRIREDVLDGALWWLGSLGRRSVDDG